MTFPEDAAVRPTAPPNVLVGLILNLLLPGAGFTYVGAWAWHLRWIAIMVVLTVLGLIVSAMLGVAVPVLLPVLGLAAMITHYGRVYAARRVVDFQPHLSDGVKIGMIVGHVVVGFFVTGILGAVLIPNLLNARQRAVKSQEQSIIRQLQTRALVQQAGGTLMTGPCDLTALPESSRALIASCTVTAPADSKPELDVTFTSGRRVQLP
ncbi:hypothetical protein [Deinococcus yunweiensis]|uniref:hypothetical protein n=1 Tax=Deinococcus yunweiensis TaxID=367282 RepID=UPI00398F8407